MLNVKLPLDRVGTPDDRASVALFPAWPRAAYATGHSVLVDGGPSLLSVH